MYETWLQGVIKCCFSNGIIDGRPADCPSTLSLRTNLKGDAWTLWNIHPSTVLLHFALVKRYSMLWMCQCLTRNIDYYSLQRFLSGAIIIWYADISIYTHIKLRSIPLESKTHWWDGVAQYRIARALKDENNRQWRRRFNKLCDNFNPLEVVSARRAVPPMHFCIPSQQQQEDTK